MRVPLLLLLTLVACGGGPEPEHGGGRGKGPKVEAPATVVEVEAVARGAVSDLVSTTALVESEKQADIIPTAPGIVLSVHREEGDLVEKGDLLVVIDNVSLDASAERARAELDRLEREHAQMVSLHARGAVSDQELATSAYQLGTARTSAREATKSFGQTRLVAPFDGVVASRDVRVGEYLSGRAAMRVVDPTRLRVVASLPERDLGRIEAGQQASLAAVYDPSRTVEGVVARIAPVIDTSSGTFRVTIEIPADQHVLVPGQFVAVALEVDRREDALVVARDAVVYEEGEPIAWRMIPEPPKEKKADEEAPKVETPSWWPFGGADAVADEKAEKAEPEGPRYVAERVPLDVGLIDTERAEILAGLVEGEQIVVVGHVNLRDGAPIQTPEMRAAQKQREEAKKAAATADGKEDGDEG